MSEECQRGQCSQTGLRVWASLGDPGLILASSFHICVVEPRPAARPLGCHPGRAGCPKLSLLSVAPPVLAFLLCD